MAATREPRVTSWRSFRALQICLALLLLTAAGLKTHQLATEPVLGSTLLESRWFLVAVVEFELFFAAWLLSGLFGRACWWWGVGTFSLFAIVAASKALAGESSCGCFGRVPTSPWFALGMDASAVVALWYCRARLVSSSGRPQSEVVLYARAVLPYVDSGKRLVEIRSRGLGLVDGCRLFGCFRVSRHRVRQASSDRPAAR